jgi:hypothetical protein
LRVLAAVAAGTGSQLLVHALPSGELLHNRTVLPNAARLHGVASAPLEGGLLAIAVHGDHYAKASCLPYASQMTSVGLPAAQGALSNCCGPA